MLQWNFKCVSMVFKTSSRCLREVSRIFQVRVKGVSRKIEWCSEKAFKVSKRSLKGEFQGSFKDIFRKFQGCLKKVSSVFQENCTKRFKGV